MIYTGFPGFKRGEKVCDTLLPENIRENLLWDLKLPEQKREMGPTRMQRLIGH